MAECTEDPDTPRKPLGTEFTRKHAVVLAVLAAGLVAVFPWGQARHRIHRPPAPRVFTTPGSAAVDRPANARPAPEPDRELRGVRMKIKRELEERRRQELEERRRMEERELEHQRRLEHRRRKADPFNLLHFDEEEPECRRRGY
jgi:hypothetical protein